ncbi:flagellar basal-body rod protein FlgF [Desulfuromonas versatilis]|uniref:Flagellar basal-body rod protein FlgF n=1 Tax=Desulfuromonas versatilis TaxID=2802975 RepID=A0ABM8HXC2_9BACT|nr:flagellar hook basal-body protein [Desulfuromonas versatilis]BCR06613.1 flagellar basal-body rod protein FlgF [Desulfuromonas versatilis]
MSSGLYSALSGATSRLQLMDTISDNLANLKTSGFKKGINRFESLLEEAKAGPTATGVNYARLQEGFSDFGQGTLVKTGVPLHLGIEGEGFFKVRDEGGNILYTRQGIMRRDAEGNLLTGSGLQVLDESGKPLNLPGETLTIDERGNATTEAGVVRIPLFAFESPGQMQRVGSGLFVAASGAQDRLVDEPRLYQGQLEESNVSMMDETTRMMEALRAFEACQKMIKTYDTLAAKADEIGSVG